MTEYLKNPHNRKDTTNKFFILPADPNLNKTELNYHSDSVNALVFARKTSNILISGSSDKSIIIWYLNPDLSQNKKRLLLVNSEVTDLSLTLNDQFLFCSCVDNNIYIYYTCFPDNAPELVSTLSVHNNIVTSLCLDNSLDFSINMYLNDPSKTKIKCASYV